MRFYGVDPLKLLYYPRWVKQLLATCLTPLRAEERTHEINSGRTARAKQDEYQKVMDRLWDLAEPYTPQQITKVTPERAAWFEKNGIPHVVVDS